jgi:hypothetical protein
MSGIVMLEWIPVLSRCLVGLILVIASITKWLNYGWFIAILRKYDLGPHGSEGVVAFLLASIELLTGVLLLGDLLLPWSGYAAAILFLVFAGAIAVNLLKGKFDIPCGCGGPRRRATIGWHLLYRNFGLVGFSFLIGKHGQMSVAALYPSIFLLSAALLAVAYFPRSSCAQ